MIGASVSVAEDGGRSVHDDTTNGRGGLAVMAALAPVSLTACSDDAEFDYSSEAQAPDRSAYSDNSEEKPDADQGLVELELDNDARLAIWIDPDDISKVYQQHSDPDDEDAGPSRSCSTRPGTGA